MPLMVRSHRIAGLHPRCVDPLRFRFKATPQVPATPNPTAVAGAQTQSNVDTQAGNMVNTTGPSGSTTYNQSGGYTDPTTGQFIPQYTENTTLNPLAQSIYTGTEQAGNTLAGTAQTLAGNANTSATTPLNFNTADSGILNQAPQATDANVANAVYNEQAGFLQPTYQQQQTDLQDQLSRQGIPLGSTGYGNAETQLANTQNQGYTAAANNATAQGSQAGSNLFNMALLGQQQNIGQQQLAQSNPLSLISQIYGGTSPTATA